MRGRGTMEQGVAEWAGTGRACVRACVHARARAHVRAHVCARVRACARARAHVCTHGFVPAWVSVCAVQLLVALQSSPMD